MAAIQRNAGSEEDATAGGEAPIHGDILDTILTHVPLIHLLPVSQVSRSWNGAVSTSLRGFNKPKPWLILHTQNTRSPYPTTAHAFDPRSRVWVEIHKPEISYVSALRSAHSSLLYMLSPAKFSFSFDPLHRTWDHVDAPIMWRTDPIVAKVGKWVVIAGGTCDFEDDPLAVEMYDVQSRAWRTCESMPAIFKDSAASTWLTIAVGSDRMYVAERSTGVGYTFDPDSALWSGPYDVRPQGSGHLCASALGIANGRLILVGLLGDGENHKVKGLKLWELDGETMECGGEIGQLPLEFLKQLEPDFAGLSSVNINFKGDFLFVTNNSAPGWVIVGEFDHEGSCGWSSVRNAVVNDDVRLSSTVVYTCADVELGDLQRATVSGGWRFSLKDGA